MIGEKTIQRACLMLSFIAASLFVAYSITEDQRFEVLGKVLMLLVGQIGFGWIGYLCFKGSQGGRAKLGTVAVVFAFFGIVTAMQYHAIVRLTNWGQSISPVVWPAATSIEVPSK